MNKIRSKPDPNADMYALNKEHGFKNSEDQLRRLVESMLDFFQVIPQSSDSYKKFQTKLKTFDRIYKSIESDQFAAEYKQKELVLSTLEKMVKTIDRMAKLQKKFEDSTILHDYRIKQLEKNNNCLCQCHKVAKWKIGDGHDTPSCFIGYLNKNHKVGKLK